MSSIYRGFSDEFTKLAKKGGFPFKATFLGAGGGALGGALAGGIASAFLSGVANDDEETSRADLIRRAKMGAILGAVGGGYGGYKAAKGARKVKSLSRSASAKLKKLLSW